MTVETVTEENFQTEVLKSKFPYVLEFWASRCPYCRRFEPELEARIS